MIWAPRWSTHIVNLKSKLLADELAYCDGLLKKEIKCKTQGAICCRRSKWYEEGEYNTTYFMNLEKINFSNKNMRSMYINDNNIITDQKRILSKQLLFYKKLYASNKEVHFEYKKQCERGYNPETPSNFPYHSNVIPLNDMPT